MKKFFCSVLVLLLVFSIAESSQILVFTDKVSYEKIPSSVDAYCSSLEDEGYTVSLHAENWENPEAIREILRQQDPLPEGAVFIGDIPIPMIRDAQHLTSAFKIDQNRYDDPQRISVPSDRFYDDPDLVFDFIGQDEDNPLLFYYSLSENSPQYIEKDFYSGRIFPPLHDEKKYAMIAEYLDRIVGQKEHPEVLDTMLTYTGHGYHSESLNSWENLSHMLREQFPNLYIPGGYVKNYYHEMSRYMKDIIIRELQEPELDMAVFHAHGGDDAQYLTGYPPPANARQNIEEVKRFVRSKLRTAKRRGNYEEAREYYLENYDIPERWIENTFDEEVIREDSLYSAYLDIYSSDVRDMQPEAEVIIFDECYNGQFFKENYITGMYVFGKGSTVAGVANTVNVRQDIWADELLGLLRHGIPLGNWHLSRNYLESHIIGDPTFHFASEHRRSPLKYRYQRLLRSDDDILRTYGVYQMAKIRKADAENKLLLIYRTDPSANVRLQALKSLAALRSPAFYELLKTSIADPSELIRRISTNWMGKVGHAEYFPLLVEAYLYDISKRVSFSAKTSLSLLFPGPAVDPLYEEMKTNGKLDPDQAERLDYMQKRNKEWLYDDILSIVKDTSLTAKKRISRIRTFRNYNFAPGITPLLNTALDPDEDQAVRTAAVEALGWFTMNPGYKRIVEGLQELCDCDGESVRSEAIKSIKRLQYGPNLSITP